MARNKQNRQISDGAEVTGVGIGTFIVGLSHFLSSYPTAQSFLIFIAPFTAVVVNTYLKRAIGKFKRSRDFRLIIRGIDTQIGDTRTSPARKKQLLNLRERVQQAWLKEKIDQIDLALEPSNNRFL